VLLLLVPPAKSEPGHETEEKGPFAHPAHLFSVGFAKGGTIIEMRIRFISWHRNAKEGTQRLPAIFGLKDQQLFRWDTPLHFSIVLLEDLDSICFLTGTTMESAFPDKGLLHFAHSAPAGRNEIVKLFDGRPNPGYQYNQPAIIFRIARRLSSGLLLLMKLFEVF